MQVQRGLLESVGGIFFPPPPTPWWAGPPGSICLVLVKIVVARKTKVLRNTDIVDLGRRGPWAYKDVCKYLCSGLVD